MKKQPKFISRCAVIALASGAFCLANTVFAQTEDASPNPTSTMGANGVKASHSRQSSGSSATSDQAPSSSMDTTGATAGTTSTTSPGTKNRAAAMKNNKEANEMNRSSKSSSTSSTGGIGEKDRAFANMAATGGMMEVHMGEMAEKQGQSEEVKKLGKQMVADHTMANTELKTVANSRGIKLETEHKMDKIDSANFDQAWLAAMVASHQKMLAAFKTEAKTGMDADVKAFATKQVPILQKHLQMVQAAQKKMGSSSSGSKKG